MCLIFLFMWCPAKSIRGNGLFSSIGAAGFLHPGMQHAPGNVQCILDSGSIEKQYLCLSPFHFEVPYSQDVDTSLTDCTVSQDGVVATNIFGCCWTCWSFDDNLESPH